jgi:hypothetical protein
MSLELGLQYVMKHRGRYDDFHTRYELAAQEACGKGGDDYRRFCQDLPRYTLSNKKQRASCAGSCAFPVRAIHLELHPF